MGFLVGSLKDEDGRNPLEVRHLFECIYFTDDGSLEVTGDFVMHNVSDEPARLRGLHRGNVAFEAQTEKWMRDSYWSRSILGREELGLRAWRGKMILRHACEKPYDVEMLAGPLEEWGPEQPDYGCAPFTGFESPEVEPGKCCLFRVAGSVPASVYRRKDGCMVVSGGVPLKEEIWGEIGSASPRARKEYLGSFDEFVDRYWSLPEFHHFFFGRYDGRPVEVGQTSTDVRQRGYKKVGWFGPRTMNIWSDRDIAAAYDTRGPVICVKAPSRNHHNAA